jgi:hypothetical protein
MITPLLINVDLSKPFILEMDVFNYAIGFVLSQLGEFIFLIIMLASVLISFFLLRLITRFMIKNL